MHPRKRRSRRRHSLTPTNYLKSRQMAELFARWPRDRGDARRSDARRFSLDELRYES